MSFNKTFRSLTVLSIAVLLSMTSFAESKKRASTAKSQKSISSRSPVVPMLLVNRSPSRWDLLMKMRKYMPPKKFNSLKMAGDRSKITYKKSLRVSLSSGGKFSLKNYKKAFRFDKSGKKIIMGDQVLSLNPALDPLQNYLKIKSQLQKIKTALNRSWWLHPAHAQIAAQESMAYDVLTLLYFTEIYMASDGSIMEDFFLDEPQVQQIIGRLQYKNLTVKIECNEDGMDFKFSDKTQASLTWSETGSNYNPKLIEKAPGLLNRSKSVTEIEEPLVADAWMFYCQLLPARELSIDANEEIPLNNLMGVPSNSTY